MKKLLTIIFFFPVLLFAQEKNEGFIKKFHYLKFSPSAMLMFEPTENLPYQNTVVPSMFAAIGGKINRYAAVGFSTGVFELKEVANPVIPLGIDLTLTDFKTKRAFPVITAQWYYTYFKVRYDERRSRYSQASVDITGKQMFNVGAGLAFRALKTKKIMITGSFAKLISKTTINLSSSPPPTWGSSSKSTTTANDYQEIFMMSASLVL
jgi:hypothetical protein